ncbi:unnamed protein product, partial [Prorocentrum cordatum]
GPTDRPNFCKCRDVHAWRRPPWARWLRNWRGTAIKARGRVDKRGPWHVLYDSAHFLTSTACQRAYEGAEVVLWHVLAHSAHVNQVEQWWGWLRKKLRAMDFADSLAKPPVSGTMPYKECVRGVIHSAKSQAVA